MRRELSAGGVLVRRMQGRPFVAAVRPQGKPQGVWALPKGLIDPGETPAETAVRETAEETGVEARLVAKLGDVRYVYTWEGERVFKIVSFFLLRPRARQDRRPSRRGWSARWPRPAGCRSHDAPSVLAYRGEREMAARAVEALAGEAL